MDHDNGYGYRLEVRAAASNGLVISAIDKDKYTYMEEVCTCGHLESDHYQGNVGWLRYCTADDCRCKDFENTDEDEDCYGSEE